MDNKTLALEIIQVSTFILTAIAFVLSRAWIHRTQPGLRSNDILSSKAVGHLNLDAAIFYVLSISLADTKYEKALFQLAPMLILFKFSTTIVFNHHNLRNHIFGLQCMKCFRVHWSVRLARRVSVNLNGQPE